MPSVAAPAAADSDPDGVRRADGERPGGERKEKEADNDAGDRQNAGNGLREAVRIFEADSPEGFENARDE